LRFHLNGEGALVHGLYELLAGKCTQIVIRDPATGSRIKPVWLDADRLRPVGFEEHEGALPYPLRSFIGYRLLQNISHSPISFSSSSFPASNGWRPRVSRTGPKSSF
jgi:type VI secretion system protein ImpG